MFTLRNHKTKIPRSGGFTLIELLVSLAIGLVVLASLYRLFLFQDEVLGRQEGLMEGNQNARNAMDVLTRDFRMAGLGVPSSVQVITAADYQSITFLVDYWNVFAKLTSQAAATSTVLNVDSITGFKSGQTIYVSDGFTAESAILAADPAGSQITLPAGLTNAFPTGSSVSVVDTVTFDYVGIASDSTKRLRRKLNSGAKEVLASDIDYMQIKYYDSTGTEISSVGNTLTSAERSSVRSLKVQIVARSDKQGAGIKTVTYEDGSTSTDGYDRIYLESTVRLRNLF
ncbi:MAG: prepilin-type N-terminal cleavage/methylation domain-containing protein [Nitrospinales bacterium]